MNLIKWFKDREDNVRDVFDANTAADQQRRISAGQPRYYQQQHPNTPSNPVSRVVHNATHNPLTDVVGNQYNQATKFYGNLPGSNAAESVGLGALRSGAGTLQGLSGLYDLATPGRGTNRFSQGLDRFAKSVDQTATNEGVNNALYHGAQGATDALQFLTGAGEAKYAAKLLSEAPRLKPVIAPITNGARVVSKPVDNTILKTADKLAQRGPAGRIASASLRSGTRPQNLAANAAMNSLYTGQQASKGEDISPQDVALNFALGSALDFGLPAGMQAGREVLSGAKATPQVAKTIAKESTPDAVIHRGLMSSSRLEHPEYKALQNELEHATRAANILNQNGGTPAQIRTANRRINSIQDSMMSYRRKYKSKGAIGRNVLSEDASSVSTDGNTVQPKSISSGDKAVSSTGSVSHDPLSQLKQEALKYKSAEEFLQAKADEGSKLSDTLEPFGKRTPDQADLENLHAGINLYDNLPDQKAVIKKFTDLYNQAHTEAKTVNKTPINRPPEAEAARIKMDAAFKEVNDQAAKDGTVDAKKWREANKLADDYWKAKEATDSKALSPAASKSAESPKTPEQTQSSASNRPTAEVQAPRAEQPEPNPQDLAANRHSTVQSSVSDSSKETPINANHTTKEPYSQDVPDFNAVAGAKGTKNARKLEDSLKNNKKLNDAARKASQDGSELHFYAKNDANGRSVGIERFNPKHNRIESGFVVDKDGRVLGNHIKVDSSGVQVNVGGDLVNMNSILGNPMEWKGKYRLSETMSRNIDRNAPTPEVAKKTKDFLISHKTQAEASYREELQREYKNLGRRISEVRKVKPRNVKGKDFEDDIFSVLNGDKTDAQIRSTYDKTTADAILKYKSETRKLYDKLLERANNERVKFGQQPIEKRKDYITHLQELSGDKSFTGEVYNSLKNSFTDEGMQKTRGGVPGNIAGRTENFKPMSSYNRFFQRRNGEKSLRDPFKAVQAYLEPALYNIHMTESSVRARSIESAFRTAHELRQMSGDEVLDTTKKLLKDYGGGNDNGKLVTGFQEYANALAKKTQRFDRQVVDSSDAAAKGLKGWQYLQRKGGQATILGNASSVLAQPLNQVITLSDGGVKNYLKGIAASLKNDKAIETSAFIRARRVKDNAPIKGKGEKILDVGGIPLQKIELAAVEQTWHTMYAKAKSAGLKGAEAVKKADYDTERLVAGRGIADRPEVYRSTIANGLMQYTLEVNAQNKAFWQDLTIDQKAKFLVAAMAVNTVMENVTGYGPLPDFLGAAIDTGQDFTDKQDKRSGASKAIGGAQRMGAEYANMNPFVSAAANTFLDKNQRQTLFGSDSQLGRFEGTAAPVQVVRNAVDAGKDLTQGKYKQAAYTGLKTVPYGNQTQKTLRGAESLMKGYGENASGNVTYPVSKDPINAAKALLFGPNATKSAQDYYNNNQRPLGKNQTQAFKDMPSGNRADYYQTVQTNRQAGKSTDAPKADKYDMVRDAFSKKDGLVKTNLYDQKELTKAVQSVAGEANAELKQRGLPEVRDDSRVAKIWANYKKQNYSDLEKETKLKSTLKNIYRTQISNDANSLLGMSNGDILKAAKAGKLKDDTLKQAVELDNLLFDKGLSSSLLLGNTIREELGIEGRYKTKSGSYRKGRKSGSKGGKKRGSTAGAAELMSAYQAIQGKRVPQTQQRTGGKPTPAKLNKVGLRRYRVKKPVQPRIRVS